MEKFHIVVKEQDGVITATVVHDDITLVDDLHDDKTMAKKKKSIN